LIFQFIFTEVTMTSSSNRYGSVLSEEELLLESSQYASSSYPRISPESYQHTATSYDKTAAFLIFFFPALGGLLFGYDIGATSAVVSQLESSSYAGVSWSTAVESSSLLQGTITSIGMFGAMLGSMTCFVIADDLGRRRTLLIASGLYLLGASIESFSGSSSYDATIGISTLIFGRLVYGYGCGFAMHGAPAYIGEMAPTEIRGLLVSLKEAFIVVGMVLGYSIGYFYSESKGGWRWTYWWASPISIIMLVGMSYLPYSARWLALKGRLTEARQSLRFVTPNILESDMEVIREVAAKASVSQAEASWNHDYERMTSPTVFPALVAGVGLVFLQQVTGQPSVLYYADSIFEDVGLDKVASIGVSLFKLFATLFATFTVDNYGRKILLYIGVCLMFSALIILVVAFLFPYTSASDCYSYTTSASCPTSSCSWASSCGIDCLSAGYDDSDCSCCDVSSIDTQKVIILVALFIYIGGYQVGFGPISWLIISEIFPLEIRGKAVSIAVVTNFFWNTVMTLFFAVEIEYIGTSMTFLIYAVISLVALVFIFYRVPETKGLSLEQIEEYFLRSSHPEYDAVKDISNPLKSASHEPITSDEKTSMIT
jgi:MFS family permease